MQRQTRYAYLYYTTDPSTTWIGIQLWNSGGSNYASIPYDVVYKNGQWVVCGYRKDTATWLYSCIAYAASPAGPWTAKDVWSGRGTATSIRSIDYADGKWALVGEYFDYISASNQTSYNRIGYATSLDGTWTYKDLAKEGRIVPPRIIYADGYWATITGNKASSSSTTEISKAEIMFSPTIEQLGDT